MAWFNNHYKCSRCGETWSDEWSCTCDDRCPRCNAEIEPTDSDDLTICVDSDVSGFRVMVSNPDAEDDPDYMQVGDVFKTRGEADLFAATLQQWETDHAN